MNYISLGNSTNQSDANAQTSGAPMAFLAAIGGVVGLFFLFLVLYAIPSKFWRSMSPLMNTATWQNYEATIANLRGTSRLRRVNRRRQLTCKR